MHSTKIDRESKTCTCEIVASVSNPTQYNAWINPADVGPTVETYYIYLYSPFLVDK